MSVITVGTDCGRPAPFPNGRVRFLSEDNTTVGAYVEFSCVFIFSISYARSKELDCCQLSSFSFHAMFVCYFRIHAVSDLLRVMINYLKP